MQGRIHNISLAGSFICRRPVDLRSWQRICPSPDRQLGKRRCAPEMGVSDSGVFRGSFGQAPSVDLNVLICYVFCGLRSYIVP